jgi:hypothetical protein
MTSGIHILNKFKVCIVHFLDELIEQFPDETKLYAAKLIVSSIKSSVIMTRFQQTILPFKDIVEARCSDEILKRLHQMFDIIGTNAINYFETMWGTLDEEDRDVIWEWIDMFISMAETYSSSSEDGDDSDCEMTE